VDAILQTALHLQRRLPHFRRNNGLPGLHPANHQRPPHLHRPPPPPTRLLHPPRLPLLEHRRFSRPPPNPHPKPHPRPLASHVVRRKYSPRSIHTIVLTLQHPRQRRRDRERCVLSHHRAISVWAVERVFGIDVHDGGGGVGGG